MDLATVLFDLSPDPPPLRHSGRPWKPNPEPDTTELVAAGLRGAMRAGVEMVGGAVSALTHPERTLDRAREAAEGVGEIVWAGLNPAPATPLNVAIGPHRRFVGVAAQLDDFKLVKNVLGGTVNDVVLAVVTGALRSFLLARGRRTEGLELRALVPVSVRTVGERHEGGNRIVVMRGPLPVYIEDPLERLRFVRHAMDGLKESKQALGAEVIAGAQNFAPPTILAQASRLNFSTRLFNLIVTNVPGPQFPLYVLGRRMERVFPVAFLPENHALAVAIMSYAGEMNFGLLGDFDALPTSSRSATPSPRSWRHSWSLLASGRPTKLKRATLQRTATPPRGRLVPQRELRVLGHLLGRPRRREHHLRFDRGDAFEFAHELFDLFCDLRADRATGGREREGHLHVSPADLHAVDQTQLHEVEAQLRVDHVGQGVHHVIDGYGRLGHRFSLVMRAQAVPLVQLDALLRQVYRPLAGEVG